jgi:hypothetical protein
VSEQLPPPLPDPGKKPVKGNGPPRNHSFFILMIFLGALLLIGSAAVCAGTSNSNFINFIPIAVAAVGSFVSVFFRGYRGIFFGFYITLGVIILGAVVLCFGLLVSNKPMSFR